MTYWLSYGGGVNSTALAVLLCEGRLPKYQPARFLWADTRDEKDETYDYIYTVAAPYLRKHGHVLEVCCDREGVLARWQRLSVVGSRTLRTCTIEGKVKPFQRHIKAHGRAGDMQLIGIDAGEEHRARPSLPTDPYPKHYPLVELGFDRAACVEVIQSAGLAVPPKSGCWHCPFARKAEVLALAKDRPDLFSKIIDLERDSLAARPPPAGVKRAQWGDHTALEWAARACDSESSGPLFQEEHPDPPCVCYDGADE